MSQDAGDAIGRRGWSARRLAERLFLGSIMTLIAVMVDRRLRRAFRAPSAAAEQIGEQRDGEQAADRPEQGGHPAGTAPEAGGHAADDE